MQTSLKVKNRKTFSPTESAIVHNINYFNYLSQEQLLFLLGKVGKDSPLIRMSATRLARQGYFHKGFHNRKVYYIKNKKNLLTQAEHKLAIVKVAISKHLELTEQDIYFDMYIDSTHPDLKHIRPDIIIEMENKKFYYEVETCKKGRYDVNQKMQGYYKEGLLNEMRFVFQDEKQKNHYLSLINDKYKRGIGNVKYKYLTSFT